jgi:hypothetical protein
MHLVHDMWIWELILVSWSQPENKNQRLLLNINMHMLTHHYLLLYDLHQ